VKKENRCPGQVGGGGEKNGERRRCMEDVGDKKGLEVALAKPVILFRNQSVRTVV